MENKIRTISLKIFGIFEQEKCTVHECRKVLSGTEQILAKLMDDAIDNSFIVNTSKEIEHTFEGDSNSSVYDPGNGPKLVDQSGGPITIAEIMTGDWYIIG